MQLAEPMIVQQLFFCFVFECCCHCRWHTTPIYWVCCLLIRKTFTCATFRLCNNWIVFFFFSSLFSFNRGSKDMYTTHVQRSTIARQKLNSSHWWKWNIGRIKGRGCKTYYRHKVTLTRNCGNRRAWSLFGWPLFACWLFGSWWLWVGVSLVLFITAGFIVSNKFAVVANVQQSQTKWTENVIIVQFFFSWGPCLACLLNCLLLLLLVFLGCLARFFAQVALRRAKKNAENSRIKNTICFPSSHTRTRARAHKNFPRQVLFLSHYVFFFPLKTRRLVSYWLCFSLSASFFALICLTWKY